MRSAEEFLGQFKIVWVEIGRSQFEEGDRHRLEFEYRPLPQDTNEIQEHSAVHLRMGRQKGTGRLPQWLRGNADELEIALQIGFGADRPLFIAARAEVAIELFDPS